MFKKFALTLVTLVAWTMPCGSHAEEAAVVTAHPSATAAGIEILQKGGNAFDAAVAVSAALAVVEPYSSGIGGGGFWLLHIAEEDRDVMIDGREVAPMQATRDMYLDEKGEVIPNLSIDGPLAAGIPGVPAALDHIAERYGELPLSISLAPAIRLAREGFVVDDFYRKVLSFRLPAVQQSFDSAEIFLDGDNMPNVGYRLKQADLAKTLESIAEHGADGFYTGKIADMLVSSVRSEGGVWTLQDLKSYRVKEREPVVASFDGMRITSAAPPSSGGVAIASMFNMLSEIGYPEKAGVDRIHKVVEVMRRAYRDRAEHLGDEDFYDVPRERLISKRHARAVVADFDESAATKSTDLKTPVGYESASEDTTHFSIIDASGNRVAATLSINYPFGSGFVAEGTGVLLNDEMDDFSIKPGAPNVYGLVGGRANQIEPGKRMLSSMSPTFLETPDRIAVVGTPGGSRIITMVMLASMAFYEGATAKQMVEIPRFHHQYLPDRIFHEAGTFGEDVSAELRSLGHALEETSLEYGNMQVVIRDKRSGRLDAASDPRGIGSYRIME